MADDFTHVIRVCATPAAAYRAVTREFDNWWTHATNSFRAVGDEVSFRFDPVYWTMRAEALVPNRHVVLECIDANHIHEGVLPLSAREEWLGTRLRWQIEPCDSATRITFIHEGLVPALACYAICRSGWEHFFGNSLKSYLDTGAGQPARLQQ